MRFKVLGILVIGALCCAISGCGGGSSSTGAFTSGLGKTALISSVTEQDYRKLCKSVVRWMIDKSTLEGVCTLTGLFFGGFVVENGNPIEGCQVIVDECAKADSSQIEGNVESCIVSPPEKLASCNRPISELDTCLNDYLVVLDDLFDTLTCSLAGDESAVKAALDKFANVPPSATCALLQAECPNLFRESNPSNLQE